MRILLAPDRLAHYRQPVFNKISEKYKVDIYAPKQKDFSGIKVAEDVENSFNWIEAKSFFVKGIWVWRTGIISAALLKKYDIYIYWGDAWNFSVWLSAIISRIRGKKVVFWTHGLYGNEGFLKRNYRILFYKISNSILLYGKHARDELIKNSFKEEKLFVINNSLNFELQDRFYKNISRSATDEIKRIVFIGRLEKNKKLDLLLNAIYKINKESLLENKINLLIVGDGTETLILKRLCDSLKINAYVTFYGACYDQEELSSLVINSDICVSPGNVGLTAMQSLVYGTPVITHDDATQQMPEYEAVIEGESGTLYKKGSVESLVDAIYRCFLLIDNKTITDESCRNVIIKYYNTDYQLKVFDEMISNL